MKTTVISKDDIIKIVASVGLDHFMAGLIEQLRNAFRDYDDATTHIRTRDGFAYSEPFPSLLEWMPAARVGESAIVKMVGYNPQNPYRFELPTIVSTLMLYDLATGHLEAICDGTFLTAMRTGAASAIASEILAPEDSAIIGLIGCGAQAVTQLHALSQRFPVKQVYVYDAHPSVARSFAQRVSFLGLDVSVVPREVVERESQIICTATSVAKGHGPVLDGEHLRADVHINAVGSDMPGKTELPLNLLTRSFVCPDFAPQAILEGECQQLSNGHIGPSLPELVRDAPRFVTYRQSATVFDSTGFALEDMVAMQLLLEHARRMNIGEMHAIEGLGYDAMNPYSFMFD